MVDQNVKEIINNLKSQNLALKHSFGMFDASWQRLAFPGKKGQLLRAAQPCESEPVRRISRESTQTLLLQQDTPGRPKIQRGCVDNCSKVPTINFSAQIVSGVISVSILLVRKFIINFLDISLLFTPGQHLLCSFLRPFWPLAPF